MVYNLNPISEVHQVDNAAPQWVIKEVDSNRTYQIIMCTVFIGTHTLVLLLLLSDGIVLMVEINLTCTYDKKLS